MKHIIAQTPIKVLMTDNDDEFFETDMLESEVNALKMPDSDCNNKNNVKDIDRSRHLISMMCEDNSLLFPNDDSQIQIQSFVKDQLVVEAPMSPIIRNRMNVGYYTPANKRP